MVLDKVCEMIASQLQVDPSIVKRESRLVEDLKADSANVMVMILELESEFGIEVEDEVILKLKTVGDVADYIEKHQ
ncbi:MAG: acyl carrier protein [Clostridia bacterium]